MSVNPKSLACTTQISLKNGAMLLYELPLHQMPHTSRICEGSNTLLSMQGAPKHNPDSSDKGL